MSEHQSHLGKGESIGGASIKLLGDLLAVLVQQSHDAIVVCDANCVITHWNQRATDLYGYTAEEAIGRTPGFLAPEGLAHEPEELTLDASDGQLVNEYITKRQRKDGRTVDISLTISPIRADSGRVLGTVGLARDISSMVRLQLLSQETEKRMNEAQALAHVGSWDWDLILEFPTWTEELCRIYGYPVDHVPSAEDLVARVPEPDRSLVSAKIEEAMTGVDNDVDYRIELPDGELRYVHARHHSRIGEDGEPIGVHGVVQDVTERKRYEAELERLATHDTLTGLPNRRTYDQRLELELARCRRDGVILCLAVMDIDRFKRINDTYGHQAGDHVLAKVGEILRAEVREDELLARIGGEEFAWILHGVDAEGARVAVERARAAIATAEFDEVGHVTVSAGICAWVTGMDGAALYRSADMALLDAKQSGRDQVITAVDLELEIRSNTLVA